MLCLPLTLAKQKKHNHTSTCFKGVQLGSSSMVVWVGSSIWIWIMCQGPWESRCHQDCFDVISHCLTQNSNIVGNLFTASATLSRPCSAFHAWRWFDLALSIRQLFTKLEHQRHRWYSLGRVLDLGWHRARAVMRVVCSHQYVRMWHYSLSDSVCLHTGVLLGLIHVDKSGWTWPGHSP